MNQMTMDLLISNGAWVTSCGIYWDNIAAIQPPLTELEGLPIQQFKFKSSVKHCTLHCEAVKNLFQDRT